MNTKPPVSPADMESARDAVADLLRDIAVQLRAQARRQAAAARRLKHRGAR